MFGVSDGEALWTSREPSRTKIKSRAFALSRELLSVLAESNSRDSAKALDLILILHGSRVSAKAVDLILLGSRDSS